jgi:type IV pilus assembly protein PilC
LINSAWRWWKPVEAGGVLDEALKRLAKLLEDTAKLQNQIKGALGYPVAVLVIAILVFLGTTIFLIPTFAGIFEDLGAELPAFTQLLVNFSELLRSSASLLCSRNHCSRYLVIYEIL